MPFIDYTKHISDGSTTASIAHENETFSTLFSEAMLEWHSLSF
jgi:hypothetical protein